MGPKPRSPETPGDDQVGQHSRGEEQRRVRRDPAPVRSPSPTNQRPMVLSTNPRKSRCTNSDVTGCQISPLKKSRPEREVLSKNGAPLPHEDIEQVDAQVYEDQRLDRRGQADRRSASTTRALMRRRREQVRHRNDLSSPAGAVIPWLCSGSPTQSASSSRLARRHRCRCRRCIPAAASSSTVPGSRSLVAAAS